MVTAILTHEVKNFSEWKKVFDADADNRSRMGVSVVGVYQSADNPNIATVITEVPKAEAIKIFAASPELKAAMERGGVIGIPEVKILNKV